MRVSEACLWRFPFIGMSSRNSSLPKYDSDHVMAAHIASFAGSDLKRVSAGLVNRRTRQIFVEYFLWVRMYAVS